MNGFTNVVSSTFLDCYHGGLPRNPQVVDYVVRTVSRLVARQRPAPAPTTTTTPPTTTGEPASTATSTPPLTTTTSTPTATTSSVANALAKCSQWLQMSRSDRLAAVASMHTAHHDPYPLLVAYGSVRLFCTGYPEHTIDGVYDGRL